MKDDFGKYTINGKVVADLELTQSSTLNKENIRCVENYIEYLEHWITSLEVMNWKIELSKFYITKTLLNYFKLKYFPNWLLKRFPATAKEVDVNLYLPSVHHDVTKIDLEDFKKSQKYISIREKDLKIPEVFMDGIEELIKTKDLLDGREKRGEKLENILNFFKKQRNK